MTVAYVGRPGLHHAGDGSEEGWFRTRGGNSMTTEPVGAEDWMPLNDYPAAKPTYDFTEVSERGPTAIANGERVSVRENPPDAEFPRGSTTTVWHAPMGIPSYLPLTIIGDYSLTSHVVGGMRYYLAQDRRIPRAERARNLAVMERQPEITAYERRWNGPFPFRSDGVVAGIPGTSDDTEEMESMIVFTGGEVDTQTLYHENMHQWWGDNVTEAGFDMTFFKEGMATFAERLMFARRAEAAAGGPGRASGHRSFVRKMIEQFNSDYDSGRGFWVIAPSHTDPYTLLANDAVYERPASAYIALWRILGDHRFRATLRAIQRQYGGGSIDETELEAAFARELPDRSAACQARLRTFFTEWFDTAYPESGVRGRRPQITGPGLQGGGFFTSACPRPPGS